MSTLAEAADLARPYTPVAMYYEESDSVEYVREAKSCVYRRIDDHLTIILGMKDREVIGFRLKGFKNFYLNSLKHIRPKSGTEFLTAVNVLEKLVEEAGADLFDDEKREAYRQARELALQDQVELRDLPEAA